MILRPIFIQGGLFQIKNQSIIIKNFQFNINPPTEGQICPSLRNRKVAFLLNEIYLYFIVTLFVNWVFHESSIDKIQFIITFFFSH